MRTVYKVTSLAITSALTLSFSACTGTRTHPEPGPRPAVAGVAQTVVDAPTQPGTADRLVANDLHGMARMQDAYIKAHPGKHGIALAAGPAGKPATISVPNDFPTLPGNVVAVTVNPDGYCISVYNKNASKANTATKAALYKSAAHGAQQALGTCS